MPSKPLEEIDVSKLLHLLDIAFCFHHLFVVEQDPRFLAILSRNRLANECDIMTTVYGLVPDERKPWEDLPGMNTGAFVTNDALQSESCW